MEIFPCACGWPTFTMPKVADLAKLLDRARSRGERMIHVDDLNRLAPNGAFLAFYQPAPLIRVETFARLSSTKSHVTVEPPHDSECFALEDRDGSCGCKWCATAGPKGTCGIVDTVQLSLPDSRAITSTAQTPLMGSVTAREKSTTTTNGRMSCSTRKTSQGGVWRTGEGYMSFIPANAGGNSRH